MRAHLALAAAALVLVAFGCGGGADGDGLRNRLEHRLFKDPKVKDTDKVGVEERPRRLTIVINLTSMYDLHHDADPDSAARRASPRAQEARP